MLGARGKADKDHVKIRRDFLSRDSRERASTDRISIKVGCFSSIDDSLRHYPVFPNRPFNVIFVTLDNVQLFVAKCQQFATALRPPLAIIHKNCDEPSPHILNQPLCKNINLVHHQPHLDRLQQLADHEHVSQEHGTKLNEDWRGKVIIPRKYQAQRDEFLQLLLEFEDISDGHRDLINTSKHRIELICNDIRRVHGARYHISVVVRQFAVKLVQKVPQEEAIEPANTE